MAETPKTAFRLRQDQFAPLQQGINLWSAYIASGVPPEALCVPAAWTHIAHIVRQAEKMAREQKRPFIFEVVAYAEDGAWRAELSVQRVEQNEVVMKLRRVDHLVDAGAADEAAGGYKVAWGGPAVRWRVVRSADGEVIKDGFADKDSAAAWMAGLTKAAA